MANTQLIIFTAVPQNLVFDPDTIKVSVLVSPRLSGDDHLGSYGDWLNWTQRRLDGGLKLTFECGGNTLHRGRRHERSASRPLEGLVQPAHAGQPVRVR